MLTDKLKNFIKDYPDFPKNGIIFKDLCPILCEPNVFSDLIENMSSKEMYKKTDAIVAIDARGFIFGSAIAYRIKKPLILARKKNKLPGDLIQKDYGLEYGEDSLSMQISSISSFQTFVIVDDLLATGGTAKCIFDLLSSKNKNVLGLNVVVELSALGGKKMLDCPVYPEITLD